VKGRRCAAKPRLIAILEEVRDPGNAGTIVRAADAAGADAVVFTGRTVDLYNPKVVRSSTGSIFHLPVAVGGHLEDVLERAPRPRPHGARRRREGRDLLSARTEGVLERPTAWLFGNEAHGPARRAARARRPRGHGADLRHAESMNLATAASVCLYESAFAQRSAHHE
jgi:TrmH family RNA methyltransferase